MVERRMRKGLLITMNIVEHMNIVENDRLNV